MNPNRSRRLLRKHERLFEVGRQPLRVTREHAFLSEDRLNIGLGILASDHQLRMPARVDGRNRFGVPVEVPCELVVGGRSRDHNELWRKIRNDLIFDAAPFGVGARCQVVLGAPDNSARIPRFVVRQDRPKKPESRRDA